MCCAVHAGDIDTDELRVAIRSLGYTPGPGDIQKLMARYDTDGSGGITFDEFVQMMTHAHSFKKVCCAVRGSDYDGASPPSRLICSLYIVA